MSDNKTNLKKMPSESHSSFSEIINSFFDHNLSSVKMRVFFTVFCLFGIWVLLVFSSSSLMDEISQKSTIPSDNYLSAFLGLVFMQFINPLVLARLIVVIIAYITALHFSGQYLKTICQLKSERSARNILVNLAFGLPISNKVFIEDGQIASKGNNSHILSFGGPGKVRIGFDSCVLLERIDGKAEIIGPTANLAGGYFTLKPIEKIRKIFNLKNHTMSFDLFARTSDGIPLRVKNIQLTFSVLKSTSKVTLTKPYPFNRQAVFWLTFHQPNIGFFDLISIIMKTTLLEMIREINFNKMFPFSGRNLLIHNNNDHNAILIQESRKSKHLLASSRKSSITIPKKSKFSQIYLSRPILHHPHYPFTNKNIFHSDFVPPNTIHHRHLDSTLIQILTKEFSNRLQQQGISVELVSIGTWTPLFSSPLIKPTPDSKKSFIREASPNTIEIQKAKRIHQLIEEFFINSGHEFQSQNTKSDSNLYLKKILRFLKMNSSRNEIRSKQNQEFLEKAIIDLENNLKENRK